MNTVTTFLLNLVKIAIAFLLAFFPLHQTDAQDTAVTKVKNLRLKVLQEVDGKVQVIDTTVQAADHAALLQSISGIRADTAMLKRLQKSLSTAVRFDTIGDNVTGNVIILNSKWDDSDSVGLTELNGGKRRVYSLKAGMGAANKQALAERVKSLKSDTIFARSIKGNRVFLKADSTMQFHRLEALKDGDVVKVRTVNPNMIYEAARDSAGNVFRLREGSEALSVLNPNDIRSIVVHKSRGAISIDSLLSPGGNEIQLKVIKDDKTGESKVYRMGANGEEEEVKADYLKLNHGNARITIQMKATVEDIMPEDKQVLKEAGARVEMKKKEALEVEEISFYPNPNNGRFNLHFSIADSGTTRVSVMDSKGEEVFVDTVEKLSGEYNRQIDLTPFGRGIYYLQIAQGKKYHTKKILVQ